MGTTKRAAGKGDRHGQTGEQFRAEGVPQKPADLGAHGDWLWDFVTGELTQNRIARRIDTMALTALCEWYQQYRRCAGEMKRRPVTAKNAYRLTIQTKLCWKEVETLSAQFGLSPTARG